ncbi:hypothetical protein H4219_002455 [Mycoemilia scoparia]|uniref:Nudix hydrolase domain-containing protein n=1 Tax=Mycoemilia scoparia TaxID=417184 RepID=A0A9W8A5G2_9FUNG|nr:hypothetical protein H4219_002455 [Mycoemilia scoparia]
MATRSLLVGMIRTAIHELNSVYSSYESKWYHLRWCAGQLCGLDDTQSIIDEELVPFIASWKLKAKSLQQQSTDESSDSSITARLALQTIRHFDQSALNLMRQQLALPAGSLPKLVLPNFKYKVPEESICEAAVLVPFCYTRNGAPSLLFEERSRKLNSHCGEVCFPGGKVDPTDKSPMETALRETEEEIGIPPSCISILGALPPIPSGSFTMRIHPFVAYIHDTDFQNHRASGNGQETNATTNPSIKDLTVEDLECNHDEVHRAFSLPISHFYDQSKQRLMQFRDTSFKIPVYSTDKKDLEIWGLTAFIIKQLLLRLDCTPEELTQAQFNINEVRRSGDHSYDGKSTEKVEMFEARKQQMEQRQRL